MRLVVSARELSLAGLLGAAGLVLVFVFHLAGLGPLWGQMFLPMHIPILLGGFLLSPQLAGLLGLIVPLISSVLTGMPPIVPVCPLMMIELAVLGASASLLYRVLRLNIFVSMFGAMALARLALALVVWLIAPLFGFKKDPIIYVSAALITGLPGIALQVVVIPWVMNVIESRRIAGK